jgi:hypothetical protein
MKLVKLNKELYLIPCLCLLTISIFFQLTALFIFSLILLLIEDKRKFLFCILTSSLFENIFPSIMGLSVSSLIYIICLIILFDSIFRSNINHKVDFKIVLFTWIIFSLFGSLNYYTSEFYNLNQSSHLFYILFNILGRLLIFIGIVYSPITNKNKRAFFESNSKPLQFVIVLFFIYFIIYSESWFGYSTVSRAILEGIDPNETSILLITMFGISIINMKKINKIFLIILYLTVMSFILLSVSRTGIICFFIYSAFIFYNLKIRFKNVILFLIIIFSFSYLDLLIGDFLIRNSENEGLGTRYMLWSNSLELINKNLYFGSGISKQLNINYNYRTSFSAKVSHNSIIDLLSWVGIFGTISYYTLVYYCIDKRKILKKDLSILIIIQMIAMLSLSWVYKDLVWITLALGYVNKFQNNENITC